MIAINVRTDFRRLTDQLVDLERRQIPFAAAKALTDTAALAQRQLSSALPSIFDRPTPFTQRSVGIKAARKNDLVAEVFIRPIQAEYLRLQETGGARSPEPGKPVLVPVDVQRNQYGNIPRGLLRRLKGRGRAQVFYGRVGKVTGFWQRLPDHRLKLLAAVEPHAEYRRRFDFLPRVRAIAEDAFPRFLEASIARALATAR